jgi:hypothetical protein
MCDRPVPRPHKLLDDLERRPGIRFPRPAGLAVIAAVRTAGRQLGESNPNQDDSIR